MVPLQLSPLITGPLEVHSSHPANCEVHEKRRKQGECAGKQHPTRDLQSAQIVIQIVSHAASLVSGFQKRRYS